LAKTEHARHRPTKASSVQANGFSAMP
jgi:hypothetical protein